MPYITPVLYQGHRLRNFEIRIGMDSVEIGNNAICYKQLESMEPGLVKNFSCYQRLFGDWISINKTDRDADMVYLQIREIRIFDSKYIDMYLPYPLQWGMM